LLIAYCSFEQGQSAKVKECVPHFHVKRVNKKIIFIVIKKQIKWSNLQNFLLSTHVCRTDSKLLLPACHHCKWEEHLLHPGLSSTGYLFPTRNSSGDDNEKRYSFLRKKTGPLYLFHT